MAVAIDELILISSSCGHDHYFSGSEDGRVVPGRERKRIQRNKTKIKVFLDR